MAAAVALPKTAAAALSLAAAGCTAAATAAAAAAAAVSPADIPTTGSAHGSAADARRLVSAGAGGMRVQLCHGHPAAATGMAGRMLAAALQQQWRQQQQ